MLDVAFKDFKAKKGRAAMCIIGVMACVLLIGVVNLVLFEMEDGLKGDLGTVNGKLFFEKNGTSYPPVGSIITESLGKEVLDRKVVDSQKSTLALFASLEESSTDNSFTPTVIVGLTPGKEQAFIENTTINGTGSLVGQSSNAVILGSETAKKYNVTVGDTFKVKDNKFKVIGVMSKVGSGWPLTIDSSMVMSLSHAQDISDRPDLISTVIIKPKAQYSAQDAENNLQDAYPKYSIYSENDTQKTIDNNLSQIKIFMNMISLFIFIVSMILIMNVMMMSVKEKTREIGTMRAIGTKRRSIMALIIYESLILSFIGGVIGILLMSPVYDILGILMGAKNVNFFHFAVPSAVVVQVALIVFVIGTFSGLIPAYLANRISPIEALRYE
ncbi:MULTISPECIES: ABC transporter permease [Methanobacterium]|uniref:ABC transporter permease n=1 Tax=Methanobacterium veterum TaxID=408577 RepID=A0A9E4ZZ02_9EURY|nr:MULTISPECIES: FtsX-like permease family protein [Methanobacterium]MCZ3365939.1 ABC transporter permease [Methanobacterium veterum]MCZ3371404.1 ABC transporter permease [Methanobacterium veterum]